MGARAPSPRSAWIMRRGSCWQGASGSGGVEYVYRSFAVSPCTRVLLVEDDTSISEPLSRALRREGYEVDVTADGPSTLDKALGEGVDLILLDIGLPELDGLEVCRRVRARGVHHAVLMPAPRADKVDTVVGLNTLRQLRHEAVPAGRTPRPGPRPAAPGHGRGLGGARCADRPGCPPGLARRYRTRPDHQGIRSALDPAARRGRRPRGAASCARSGTRNGGGRRRNARHALPRAGRELALVDTASPVISLPSGAWDSALNAATDGPALDGPALDGSALDCPAVRHQHA